MERVVVVVAVGLLAVVVAVVVERRRPARQPAETGYRVPEQIHRVDFDRPDAPWLVAVFTSATCRTCAGMWEKAQHLDSDAVVVQQVELAERGDLHERYRIDAVPTTVVADAAGVVRASFLGPATATDLWAALAELREPGSVPDSCDTHVHEN